ncbi:PA2778 family cysteine peptidase [Thiomicrorhabdus heinhorstiae]|uniref:PA2778 family cysteine peptidase n=1 Tax=Thiomicrorhabdus heinhorstiae TaxID=2748010 RepID=A0ABS0BWI2_9GAMM|nr:PA2778 family cysteine peptidase [Thiomicrorhabdus heinhorstiae]MBF6057425.1 PA2778 family cysteine peptidase [Thiomicrorhabdus heinhorstiae]
MFNWISARFSPGVLYLLYSLSLAGCSSTPQTNALPEALPITISHHVELSEVPFFPQKAYQCGPAALATMLSYRELAVTDKELVSKVYLPQRRGSVQIEMIATARSYGMLAYPLEPNLKNIVQEVAAGNPVLVFQNLSLPFWPQWHYAVVVGYDLDEKRLILRSGDIKRHDMSMATFERTWDRAKDWAYVIMKPGIIPVTADAVKYVLANHDLEGSGFASEALQGYRAAAARWPDNSIVLMTLANSEQAAGHLTEAEKSYKREIELRPANANAWNNLAYNLVSRKCILQAQQAISCALRLNPADSNILQSFKEIQNLHSETHSVCELPACPLSDE